MLHKLYMILLVFIFALIFNGCEQKEEASVSIGISPWPGYEPLVLGMEKGFYEDLNIRIIRYATPSESFRALRDGVVDVAAFTIDESLRYSQMKQKPKVFLILDVSNGSDAIVARPEIKTLNDLKGKRVCIEPSALGDYLIHRAMDFTDNLKVSDFEVSAVELGKHVELYKSGEIDALVTYEPFRSQLLENGAHVIFDSKQIPNEIVDVLVTEDETLIHKSEALKKVIDGWYKTIDYITKNKKEAMSKMATYEYVSADLFEKAYDDLIIPSREETIKMLGSKDTSFQASLKKLSQLMYEKGTIEQEVDTTIMLDNSLIKKKN